jgi:hypothetical protein
LIIDQLPIDIIDAQLVVVNEDLVEVRGDVEWLVEVGIS